MGNLLRDLAEKYNLESTQQQAWGTIEGYWFQIEPPAYGKNKLTMRTAIHLEGEEPENAVANGLAALVDEIPTISYKRNGGAITLERQAPFIGFKISDVEAILLRLTSIFRGAGAAPGCFGCGGERADSFASVNGAVMKLCAGCQAGIRERIERETAEHESTQNRYLAGAFGALVGALVGSVAWVVIGLLGYLAAIGGVAIAFCAAKGYTLMKGKINKPAILIICLISIAVMVFAQFVSYDIALYNGMNSSGPVVDFWTVAQHTFEIPFIDSEITGAFVKDLLLGLLFLALGSYSTVRSLFAHAKAPAGTFERL